MNRKASNFLGVSSWVVLILLVIGILMAGCSKKSTEAGEEAVIIKSLYAPSSVQNGKTGVVDVEVKDDKDHSLSGVREIGRAHV